MASTSCKMTGCMTTCVYYKINVKFYADKLRPVNCIYSVAATRCEFNVN